MGKTQAAVLWALRHGQQAALRGQRGVIWIVYPIRDVSKTAWRKFMDLTPRGWITKLDGTEQHPNAITMGGITYEFKSAVSGVNLVGEGLLALWMDECGLIPRDVWEESLTYTLIDNKAPALFTGTPKGQNWFYDMFVRGLDPDKTDYLTWSEGPMRGISSYANPFVPREELDRQLASDDSSMLLRRQEVLAEFIAGKGYFRQLDRAIALDVEAERLGFALDHLGCSTRRTAALGIDLARTKDHTVIIGLDNEGWVTYFDRFNQIDWPTQRQRIQSAWKKLDMPVIVLDATGGSVGDPIYQELRREGIRVDPFQFTGKSKVPLMERLAMAFDDGKVKLPDRRHPQSAQAFLELSMFQATFTASGHMKLAAPEGKHDDIPCALALAMKGAMRYGGDLGVTI